MIEQAPLGARIADRVTAFLGSWRFLVIRTILVVIWIAGNVVLLFSEPRGTIEPVAHPL